jgi:hypothetical protein
MHVGDIPPSYLALYRDAATATGLDWAILAAIGSVETDHGRSVAQGVRSGVNANGCCAGPMQFSVIGRPSTWDSYGAGGNVYDPADAIPAAARYLKASGAPGNYHAAILAYNHSEAYYATVTSKARAYRDAAPAIDSGKVDAGPIDGGSWLATVPGTGIQCDRRIVPNVATILERYHAHLTACYAASGHASDGEHPLGLAVDLVPQPPSSWAQMERLARDSGWRESCATSGCAGQTGTAFRFVGYNGYVGPRRSGARRDQRAPPPELELERQRRSWAARGVRAVGRWRLADRIRFRLLYDHRYAARHERVHGQGVHGRAPARAQPGPLDDRHLG